MANLAERLEYLRRRAKDPSSTDNERKVAATVAARLEKRLKQERRVDPEWTATGRVRKARGPDVEPTGIAGAPIDAPWPDGWTGPRERADYESASNGDSILVSWDCPSCEGNVAKGVPMLYIYRLLGTNIDPANAIHSMMDGMYNQLCDICTARHRAGGG